MPLVVRPEISTKAPGLAISRAWPPVLEPVNDVLPPPPLVMVALPAVALPENDARPVGPELVMLRFRRGATREDHGAVGVGDGGACRREAVSWKISDVPAMKIAEAGGAG